MNEFQMCKKKIFNEYFTSKERLSEYVEGYSAMDVEINKRKHSKQTISAQRNGTHLPKEPTIITITLHFYGCTCNNTRCSEECVVDRQLFSGAHVPKELNRQVKALFSRGIWEYIGFHLASPKKDKSPLVDFETYMNNYEE